MSGIDLTDADAVAKAIATEMHVVAPMRTEAWDEATEEERAIFTEAVKRVVSDAVKAQRALLRGIYDRLRAMPEGALMREEIETQAAIAALLGEVE